MKRRSLGAVQVATPGRRCFGDGSSVAGARVCDDKRIRNRPDGSSSALDIGTRISCCTMAIELASAIVSTPLLQEERFSGEQDIFVAYPT